MPKYEIAHTVISYQPRYPRLERKLKKYRLPPEDSRKPEIPMRLKEGGLEQIAVEYPGLSMESLEYLCMGSCFYRSLIHLGKGFMLHASAIEADGYAYLFSAPCGTGKSTHTGLWRALLGEERTRMINDDKPAILEEDGIFYAYGTPFSGKTDLNLNIRAPVKGIAILEQGENRITRISPKEALYPLLNQMERPEKLKDTEKLLSMLDRLLQRVPVYRLQCEPTEQAARMAFRYMTMFPGYREQLKEVR